jgi:hypothetical protein
MTGEWLAFEQRGVGLVTLGTHFQPPWQVSFTTENLSSFNPFNHIVGNLRTFLAWGRTSYDSLALVHFKKLCIRYAVMETHFDNN